MRSLSILLCGLALGSACATSQATSGHDGGSTDGEPLLASFASVLDAQLKALEAGDVDAAVKDYAANAVFSGPMLDQVGADADAPALAADVLRFMVDLSGPPRVLERHEGGLDLATVRWAVVRAKVAKEIWLISTLFTYEDGWRIAAQSWDRTEPDAVLLRMSLQSELPEIGALEAPGPIKSAALTAWLDMLAQRPTENRFSEPLRMDSFAIGTAGEYIHGDSAHLETLRAYDEALASGRLIFEGLPGRLARFSRDGSHGVAVFHTAMILNTPEGQAALPMRATIYFLREGQGFRLLGAHFMATP